MECFTIDICPDLLISGLTAAAAAAFYLIYMAITVKAGRRKKRSPQNFFQSYDFNHLLDFFTVGKFLKNHTFFLNYFLYNYT